jgi:hypothetical protein
MKKWKPRRRNPQNAKNNYMVSENNHVGYIANHPNYFEDKWDKILALDARALAMRRN